MSDRLIQRVQGLGRPRVLVVGDYMLDRYVWGSVERISQEAPIPVLKVDRRDQRPGGAGSVAANIKALDARPAAAGIIGRDDDGRQLRELLKAAGTATAGLRTDPSRPTTVKTRLIARSQQILRVDEEPNGEIDAAVSRKLTTACADAVARSDAVVVQDHGKGTVTRPLIAGLVRACRRHHVPLIIDPAPTGDYSKYAGATLLTPNRAETLYATGVRITDEHSANRAARKLIRLLDLQAAVITLDREGMTVTQRGRRTHMLSANAVEVYDVTGAGDVVSAVIAVSLASGQELIDAAHIANTAAGIEVGKIGAATVSPREILERIHGGFESKIKARSDLTTICSDLHSRGRQIVFTNGCFDLLHIGHVWLLQEAKKCGDVLIVAINSDASTRLIKGPGRPVIPEDARAGMLAALSCVDYVTIYDEDTPIPLLKLVQPDVIVKGGEYGKDGVVGGQLVESIGGRIENVPMIKGFSTTQVAERAGKAKHKRMGTRGYVKRR